MGVYQYDDPQTGKGYDLNIVGNAPTEEEFARLANQLRQDRSAFLKDYEERYGTEIEFEDGTALGRGYERGKKQVKQAFGETIGTAGEASGLGFLEKYGTGLEERARQELGELSLVQPERMQSTDVEGFGTGATYLGELAGEQATQLGLGLGAAIAAPIVFGATGVAAPLVIGAGAAALITAPILFGNNVQRQEDEVAAGTKDKVDLGDALTATFGQATLEGLSDRLLLGLGKPLLGVGKAGWKGLLLRTTNRAGTGAATESLTEVGQQMMERAQAGLPIDSEEAIAEYREAAIAGGLIGGGTRATIGAFGERGDEPVVIPKNKTDAEQEAAETLLLGVEPTLAITAPGTSEAGTGAYTPDTIVTPIQEGQQRTGAGTNVPSLDASAVAVANNLAGDRQLLDAAKAIEAAGKATVPVLRESLGLSQSAAIGLMRKLEAAGVVSKYTAGKPRSLTLPFEVAAVPNIATVTLPDAGGANAGLGRKSTNIDAGLGDGVSSSGQSLEQLKRGDGARGNTTDAAPPVTGPVGDNLRNVSGDAVSAELGAGTLKARAAQVLQNARKQQQKGSMQLVSKTGAKSLVDAGLLQEEDTLANPILLAKVTALLAEGPETVLNRVGAGTLETEVSPKDVADLTEEVDAIVTEPIVASSGQKDSPEAAAERQRIAADPEAYAEKVRQAKEASGYNVPAEVLVDSDEIAARKATLAEGAAAPVQVSPNAGLGGAMLGTAGQNIPKGIRVPNVAPQIGASIPQRELQAVAAARDAAAQAELDRRFEFDRNKKVKAYHDTQVDVTQPEVTTHTDKEGILDILRDRKAGEPALTARESAAKIFFSRFRRPVDALDEMGAASTGIGFTQTVAKNYVSVQTPNGRVPQLPMYTGQTRSTAVEARKWVLENLSPAAMAVTRDAAVLARRGTYKYVPTTADINAKRKENNEKRRYDYEVKKDAAAYAKSLESGKIDAPKKAGDSGLVQALRQKDFEAYELSLLSEKSDARITLAPAPPWAKVNEAMLLIDPVHGLNQALLPSIRNALQRGDLAFALNAIASTNPITRIRQIAANLAEVVGTTKVEVVDDLSQVVGRRAAGMFDPETNTIYIDASRGMNVHTVLHEMTHAGTSASLENLSLPETKQLQRLLEAAREQLGDVRGTKDMNEFLSEAFSNPDFQTALALMKVDNFLASGWKKFTNAVRNILRKLMGMESKRPESPLDEVDRIILGMLTPSPETRSAPQMMLDSTTVEGNVRLAQDAIDAVPTRTRDEYVQFAGDILYDVSEPAARGIKNIILGSLDSRILTDIAKKKIPFAPELNILIRKMSGAMRDRSDKLDAMTGNYSRWARKKENKAAVKILNNIIPKSTHLRVDPSMPREFYSTYKAAYSNVVTNKAVIKEFPTDKARKVWMDKFNKGLDSSKATKAKPMKNPEPNDLVAYDALNAQYRAMGSEGQAFYRQMRNFFQDTYDEIIPALRARLEATIPDAVVRATAFEKLQDILLEQSGIIRPYFPLMRKGKHRLQYYLEDANGQEEVVVQYFKSRRNLDRAFKLAVPLVENNRDPANRVPEYTRADQPMSFKNVPSSSFVFDILKSMEASKDSFRDKNGNLDNKAYEATIQGVVDLALDAMPERSFMQGFRQRGDGSSSAVRGYIGDMTPTNTGDQDFNALNMMQEKGRDLNRQLVQIQAAAELEKFRRKLKDGNYLKNPETADIARKLDQQAAFAQSPNVPRWSQVANGVGFNMTMGLNFSSAALTFFDVGMSSMPVIAAEYGAVNTARAYGTATRLLANAPKTRGVMVTGSDGSPVEQEVKMGIAGGSIFNYTKDTLPPEQQADRLDIALDLAREQGQVNQSLTQESLEIGRDAPLEGVNKWTSAMFHHAERVGRETTFVSSYTLESKKLQAKAAAEGRQVSDQDYRDAAQKAIETTEFTLGSTAAAGRPTWAYSGAGNILFLFKRFAIAKYYMMYKLGHDSIGSTKIDKIMQEQGVTQEEAQQMADDRKLARVGLRNFLISTGLMAGVGGMPMMGTFGVIYNMFADDDEDDWEAANRKFFGEGMYGGLANQLLGVDAASRISLHSLLYRPPFIEKDQSPLWTFAEQVGGPVLGLSLNTIRGGGEIWESLASGNMQTLRRGFETIAPSAIRNLSQGERFYREGTNTRRGDPITEQISLYSAVMKAAGWSPEAYARELAYNRNAMRRNKAVEEPRGKLLRRLNMARRSGDRDEVQKVLEMVKEFNTGLPEGAEYRKITQKSQDSSYDTFIRNDGKIRGGAMHTEFMDTVREGYDRGFQGM